MRVVWVVLVLSVAVGAEDKKDPFVDALAHWKRQINRPPLTFRLGAMRELAGTRDARVLPIFAKRYRSPRLPKDHERYLLARIAGTYFTKPAHADALWNWVRKNRKDEDGWLWFNALRAAAASPDVAPLAKYIRGSGNVFTRAAALEALAAAGRPEALALIPDMLQHAVAVESCAAVLRQRKLDLGTPEFREAALRVIAMLEAGATSARTKLVIARHLADVFDVDDATTDPLYWRQLLHFQEVKDNAGYTRALGPQFFGIRASGARVVYVIDMSDSMTAKFTSLEKFAARLRLPELKIDWDTVHSRFDLARACIRASLRQLSKRVRFMIVGFGSEAFVFRSTKGLVPASRGNVAGALKELDAIEVTPQTAGRPYGKLRGSTNVHGGILRAFRVRGKKLVRENEHVVGMRKGADTVFLLSDGQPTEDDFGAQDKFAGGTLSKDSETGETTTSGAGSAVYFGPYRGVAALLGDVRRLNLFRKVEMHCIGMGEADGKLMHGIADIGMGTYRSLGAMAKEGRFATWWVIGAFDAKRRSTWADAEFPEHGVELRKTHTLDGRKARWQRVRANSKGAVRLARRFKPGRDVAGYAFSTAYVERETNAALKLAFDGGTRVWVNGELVSHRLTPSRFGDEQDPIAVRLKPGRNEILIKLCHETGAWRFSAKLTAIEGAPLVFVGE